MHNYFLQNYTCLQVENEKGGRLERVASMARRKALPGNRNLLLGALLGEEIQIALTLVFANVERPAIGCAALNVRPIGKTNVKKVGTQLANWKLKEGWIMFRRWRKVMPLGLL
jgi:hypothetical protein